MSRKSVNTENPAVKTAQDIRRRTRKQFSAAENIRIFLSGLRDEDSIFARFRGSCL